MNTTLEGVTVSPVNMEDRKNLGLKAGDTVKVHQKIQEKGKTRIQVFDGLVLTRKHGNEPGATFTVRKVSSGVGVEKIFPLYSPVIDKIEIVKRAKVRRAKLYYIREKVTKEIKRQMRRMSLVSIASESGAEAEARKEAEEAKAAEEAEAKAAKEAENNEAENNPEEAKEENTENEATEEVKEEENQEESAEASENNSETESKEEASKDSEEEDKEEETK